MQPGPPRRHFTTHRPVAVLMVFISAVVFGFFSLRRLPVTLMPELSYPTLTVRTEYPGTAPEEVENEISRPIEEALGVVGGLNKISSVSRPGLSDVILEFTWGTDMSKASQEVLEKIDLVFLPREAERPLILHFDPSLDPILELSLAGTGERFAGEQGLRRLRRLAELQVKRALERIKGVAAVRVRGGLEEEFHVLLDKKQLVRTGLSIQTVIDRLRQENINVAGGTLKEGRAEYMVRTLNEFVNLEELANTVVARIDNGEVRIKDLGRVVRAHKDREILTRTDGAESVQIDIYKEAEANMVAVAKAVAMAVGQVKPAPVPKAAPDAARGPPERPEPGLAPRLAREEGATLNIVADRSKFIESSINEVWSTALMGGILAVIVLYVFLGDLKTTAIVSLSIPMSLIITFAPLNLAHVSLNIMSLGGLALGIGMLVDCSIVVLESIFRCREEGDDLVTAAIRGTREVKSAVVASTLTTVAVFLPMVFVEGIAGQAFSDLGLAVVTSLLASLVVAVYFVPMLASRRGMDWSAEPERPSSWRAWHSLAEFRHQRDHRPPSVRTLAWVYLVARVAIALPLEFLGKVVLGFIQLVGAAYRRALAPIFRWLGRHVLARVLRVAQGWVDRFRRAYPPVIRWTLRQPGPVLALTAISAWLTWTAGARLETELLPEVHQGEFTFEVNLAVGTPLEETTAALEGIERAILADKADIERLIVTFGYDVTNVKRSDEGEHSARFKVIIKRQGDALAVEERVLARLRTLFTSVPDAEVRVVRPVLFSAKAPLVIEIEGDDLQQLKAMSQRAESLLGNLPELADVEASLRAGAPEIQVVYQREKLAIYGLNIATVARQVRDMVKGFEASRFNQKDRRIPIVVRLDEPDRQQAEDVGRLLVNPGGVQPIPLSSVADLRIGEGPSEIRRVDGQRIAQIEANLGHGSLGGAARRIDAELRAKLDWPPDMAFSITGQNEEWERSRGSLYLALGLSLFLVYVIMAAQFESLLQPLLIMVSVPLAFFGSAMGLAWTGTNLSIVVFLGLITLAGIVVNNAIVLVDYANTLRARGIPLGEAIATAGAVRLRPILLTTITTVLGLLPMSLGLGDGAEIRTPMALTVVFGLMSSTLLTLVVIPTLYYITERWRERLMQPAAHEPTVNAGTPPTPA